MYCNTTGGTAKIHLNVSSIPEDTVVPKIL